MVTRRWVWRIGRKLYMWARRDAPNDMETNGELRLQRLLVSAIDPAAKVIAFDVGARIGDWSKAFVDGAQGRPGGFALHAFEPVPDSRSKLEQTLAPHIAAGEARVIGIALSDEAKTVPIYIPHFTGGTSTLLPDSGVKYQEVIDVETGTLDRYCADQAIDHVDLIKIDTEGNDLRVIRGASELLRAGRVGVVQFEYNHRWMHARHYLRDVFEFARDTPYHVAKVCSSSLEVYTEWHPELERYFETNYALVHERLLGQLHCVFLKIGSGNACEAVVPPIA